MNQPPVDTTAAKGLLDSLASFLLAPPLVLLRAWALADVWSIVGPRFGLPIVGLGTVGACLILWAMLRSGWRPEETKAQTKETTMTFKMIASAFGYVVAWGIARAFLAWGAA